MRLNIAALLALAGPLLAGAIPDDEAPPWAATVDDLAGAVPAALAVGDRYAALVRAALDGDRAPIAEACAALYHPEIAAEAARAWEALAALLAALRPEAGTDTPEATPTPQDPQDAPGDAEADEGPQPAEKGPRPPWKPQGGPLREYLRPPRKGRGKR